MKNFIIMADATCDVGEDLQKQYDIVDVPSHIILPGGKDIPSFHEWKEFSREQFYNDLKARPDDYSTAPPNVAEFAAVFEQYAAKGTAVLLLTISTGISGTYDFAVQAQKEVLEKYPDAQIRCIDSQRFGPSCSLLAIYASLMRKEGHSFEEVCAYLDNNKNRLHQAGWLDDLSFVAKRGRMTHAKAFFGTLAGIKPIGEFDYNGLTTIIGKVKGAKAGYELLMHYISKTIEKPEEQIVVVAHTNRLAQAEAYRDMIEKEFHPKEILIRDVFPMCGISVGPGLMAAYYMGTPISQGLVNERGIIENYLKG